MSDTSQNPPAVDRAGLAPLLGLATVIGLLAALGASLFSIAVHQLEHLLWDVVPEWLGLTGAPALYVLVLLLAGAVGVWGACRLPGHGGHHPLDGFSFDIGTRQIASVLLAALASLAFGAVVGPEAPLVALGTATAAWVARRTAPSTAQLLMLAGAMAAMGTIFGNPMVTAVLLLEATALTGASATATGAMMRTLPALLALGTGYLVQVGLGPFAGLGETVLAVPGLPAYPTVQILDLVLSLPLAVAVALVCVASLRLAGAIRVLAQRAALVTLLVCAAGVAALAVAVSTVTGTTVNVVLFSGQSAIPDVLALTSGGTLVLILVGKALAYGLSLGGGFRGGMIFPGVYLGVVTGVLVAGLLPAANVAALVAAGIAAAVASIARLPFTAVLLAVLLCSGAGLAVTTSAIVAAVVGLLVRLAVDQLGATQESQRPQGATA